MDAGVIRCLKANYRCLLLPNMLQSLDDGKEFAPTLFMAFQLLSQAWHSIEKEKETITKDFRHCGFIYSSPIDASPSSLVNASFSEINNIFERLARFLNLHDRLKPIDYCTVDDSTQVCAPST